MFESLYIMRYFRNWSWARDSRTRRHRAAVPAIGTHDLLPGT